MNRKPSMLVVFLTVFIDLIGFGIVVPLVPMYSRHYGASGWMIGAIIASFSAMQFVFSPIWGKLSDRYGRRPILLISTAGAACSYVIFAIGSGFADHSVALGTLLVSRLFAGACGGNITVAQAYVADITPPENRSKRMGLIGMAFGLGFIFGPAISGVALKLGGADRARLDGGGPVRGEFSPGLFYPRRKLEAEHHARRQPSPFRAMGPHALAAENRSAHFDFLSRHVRVQLF
jgi:MFS family permease